MFSELEKIFEQFEYPYSRQGSYAEGEKLPESFFTFWNTETSEIQQYDNVSHGRFWYWNIYFYTSEPEKIYSEIEKFCVLAKENKFIITRTQEDIPSGIPDYNGRFCQVLYIEDYSDNTVIDNEENIPTE